MLGVFWSQALIFSPNLSPHFHILQPAELPAPPCWAGPGPQESNQCRKPRALLAFTVFK